MISIIDARERSEHWYDESMVQIEWLNGPGVPSYMVLQPFIIHRDRCQSPQGCQECEEFYAGDAVADFLDLGVVAHVVGKHFQWLPEDEEDERSSSDMMHGAVSGGLPGLGKRR